MGWKALLGATGILVLAGSACAQNPPASGVRVSIPGCESDCTIQVQRPENEYDIRELVRRVAANAGLTFVIDPRVRASVEYAGAPIESIDYTTLLAILRVHGYVSVEIGRQISIVPDANARTMPTRILPSDDPSVSDHEVVSRIISLDSDAAVLVPIIRPLVPQYGHLAAVGNSLLIVDRYDNVRRITALVNELTE
jgi:general secretion pathway protein D